MALNFILLCLFIQINCHFNYNYLEIPSKHPIQLTSFMSNQNNISQQQDQLSFSFKNSKNDQDNSYSYFQIDQDSIQNKSQVNLVSIKKPNTRQIIYENVYGNNQFQNNTRQKKYNQNQRNKNNKFTKIYQQFQKSQLQQQSIQSNYNGCQYYQNLYRNESIKTNQYIQQKKKQNYTPLLKQLQNELNHQFISNEVEKIHDSIKYQYQKKQFAKNQDPQFTKNQDPQVSGDSLEMSQINYYQTIYHEQLKKISQQKRIQLLKTADKNFKNSIKKDQKPKQQKFDQNLSFFDQKLNDGNSFQNNLSLSVIKNQKKQVIQKIQQNNKYKTSNKFDKLDESDLSIIKMFSQIQNPGKNLNSEYNIINADKKLRLFNKNKRGNSYLNSKGKIQQFQNFSLTNQQKISKLNIDFQNQRCSKFQLDIIKSLKQQEQKQKHRYNHAQNQLTSKKQQLEFQQGVKKHKIYVKKLKNQKVPKQVMNNLKKYSKFQRPKHHSIYYVYSTPLVIIKQSFNFLESDALVVPYRQLFYQSETKIQDSAILKYLNKYLTYDLINTLKKHENKKELTQGSIIKFEALGIKNLTSLYMLKMSTTNLQNHASKILGQGVKKIFNSIIDSRQKNTKASIIFPAVNYHGIKRQKVGQTLLPQILMCLAQIRHKYKGEFLLKQIIISVPKEEQYLQYLRVMDLLMIQYRKVFAF